MAENVSVITMFFLSGLNETMNHKLIFFSLTFLCYCLILLVNLSVILTIIWDKSLHEPMYILVCTFCINGLYGPTGFYPKFLWDLLAPAHVISYSGCLIQSLVIYSFAHNELCILAVMAYDRYVAICRPLEYHSIMSKQRLFKLVCVSVIIPVCTIAMNIFLTSRLKLCSPHITRLYCVNLAIVKLACFPAQTTLNAIIANVTIIIYALNGLSVICSYTYVIKMCVHSVENRRKFMQTCVPHLSSLFICLVTNLFKAINIQIDTKHLPQTLRRFVEIEFLVIPPVVNPLIYGLKLTKIRNRILAVIVVKKNLLLPQEEMSSLKQWTSFKRPS